MLALVCRGIKEFVRWNGRRQKMIKTIGLCKRGTVLSLDRLIHADAGPQTMTTLPCIVCRSEVEQRMDNEIGKGRMARSMRKSAGMTRVYGG